MYWRRGRACRVRSAGFRGAVRVQSDEKSLCKATVYLVFIRCVVFCTLDSLDWLDGEKSIYTCLLHAPQRLRSPDIRLQ